MNLYTVHYRALGAWHTLSRSTLPNARFYTEADARRECAILRLQGFKPVAMPIEGRLKVDFRRFNKPPKNAAPRFPSNGTVARRRMTRRVDTLLLGLIAATAAAAVLLHYLSPAPH